MGYEYHWCSILEKNCIHIWQAIFTDLISWKKQTYEHTDKHGNRPFFADKWDFFFSPFDKWSSSFCSLNHILRIITGLGFRGLNKKERMETSFWEQHWRSWALRDHEKSPNLLGVQRVQHKQLKLQGRMWVWILTLALSISVTWIRFPTCTMKP